MEVITEIHKNYCVNCPSKWHPSDPESEDIKALPDGERQKYVFPCAWRPNKLCRGVCEELGYNEADHAQLVIDSRTTTRD